jgi:Xaa-Pro aminopeptidase
MKKEPILLVAPGADETDILYRITFRAPDLFFCLIDRGRVRLLTSELELGRAARAVGRANVHSMKEFRSRKSTRQAEKPLKTAARWLRALGVTSVRVTWRAPCGLLEALRDEGVTPRILKEAPFPERATKSPEEIRSIREAQRAAVRAMRRAVTILSGARTGADGVLRVEGAALTSEALRAEIEKVLLESDCEGGDTIVACGDQAVDPHERGRGPLRVREFIVIDIFPRSRLTGYWGDLTRTWIRDGMTPEQKSMYRAVLLAQRDALRAIRPGAPGATVHAAAVERLKREGFETVDTENGPEGFIHGTGHGVGLDIHEPPRISFAADTLRKGQVVTVEPGLYYRGLGGVRIEDTVVVGNEGPEILVHMKKNNPLLPTVE